MLKEVIMYYYPDRDHTQYITVATQSSAPLAPLPASAEAPRASAGLADHGDGASSQQVATISVLLVDDHALMREGLRQLFALEQDIQVVDEAVDGFEAMQKVRRWQPDVVLMDIHMPVVDGIAVTRQITREFPAVAVIILTIHCQRQQLLQAMECGARGYLLKSTSVREVTQAIRRVHAGDVYIAPNLTGELVGELQRLAGGTTTSDEQRIDLLAEKELEIIRYVATGMTNREIAQALAYSEKTVKNYLSVIFQKLHLRDRTQVAIFALRQGWLPNG
jgi:DNA-binding NarL/FixJ family response regulator